METTASVGGGKIWRVQNVSDVWPRSPVSKSQSEKKSGTADFSMSVEDDYTRVAHSFFHSHITLHFA